MIIAVATDIYEEQHQTFILLSLIDICLDIYLVYLYHAFVKGIGGGREQR